MAPTILTEIRLLLVLTGICFLPGSALLAVSGTWRRWRGLQRYIVAIGLSLAFYPVLFYTARFLLPGASLGPYTLVFLLLLAALITGWEWWRWRGSSTTENAKSLEHTTPRLSFWSQNPEQYARNGRKPDWLEWAALAVIGLTFTSRLWFAHVHPFPAWSDSLHHTLLTQLTAEYGRLPTTLDPYFPNSLEMYHLGLYALSGTAEMLAQVSSHTALLWAAQFLNGLCGIGIYLALDRCVGRTGAVVGTAVAGLFSAHPALWANWGRFTQLSSQTILLIAWVLTLEAIAPRGQKQNETNNGRNRFWTPVFAAMATAAVFLFHFRVAIFYLLLMILTLIVVLGQASSSQQRWVMIKTSIAIGGIALLLVLPVLWDAAGVYLSKHLAPKPEVDPAQHEQLLQNYYRFPLSTVPYLAAPVWMLVVTAVAGLIGAARRNTITLVTLIWTISLLLLGNAYLLGISVLNVTNLGAILIMLYLPIGLIIGAGVEEGLRLIPKQYQGRLKAAFITLLLIAALPATRTRATTIEPHRHFMTAADRTAMTWIEENVPPDATFAINTYFWLPNFAHGTDAGYWIPYWTGREIITSTMLSDGLSADYRRRTVDRSRAAEALETDLATLEELYKLGVEYIYVGAQGDFSGVGLRPGFLMQSDRVELLYENDGTAILRIHPANQQTQ